MAWVAEEGFERRPLVVVEDHLYHMTELLERLGGGGRPPIYDQLTVVCLDRPGPDTSRTAASWLSSFPGLQVTAAVEPGVPAGAEPGGRLQPLPADAFSHSHRLCQAIAAALRPGGLLLQDIQLETLAFIPADRWWESIYLASTVRGMFAERPPACRFISNKRGYEATFGRDLLAAGFDPREVIDKSDLDRVVVPALRGHLARCFPLALRLEAPGRPARGLRVGRSAAEREEVESDLDLVLWSAADGSRELGGRALAPAATAAAGDPARRRIAFKPGNQEAATWQALLADRLSASAGLAVLDVGERLAPAGAGKAEITNVAARHVHTLRCRLADPAAILTAHHRYRLSDRLAVGLAEEAPAV